MPWITFTPDHVLARLAVRELEVYEAVAGGEYQEDGSVAVPADAPERMPQIVEQVCDRFRGAIRANPSVRSMGPAGTLPSFVIYDAAVIARHALIGMPPVPEGMTDPRRDEYRAAEKLLADLREMDAKAFEDDPAPSPVAANYGGEKFMQF